MGRLDAPSSCPFVGLRQLFKTSTPSALAADTSSSVNTAPLVPVLQGSWASGTSWRVQAPRGTASTCGLARRCRQYTTRSSPPHLALRPSPSPFLPSVRQRHAPCQCTRWEDTRYLVNVAFLQM